MAFEVNDRLRRRNSDKFRAALCIATDRNELSLVKVQVAELGLADAHRVLQQRLEHRLQLAGRTGDDVQHFGGGGLLLQRLGKVLPSLGEFAPCFSSCCPVGSGSVRPTGVLAFASVERRPRMRCSALRPLARQGHLVGTVTGPLPVGPSQGSSLSILTEANDELAPFTQSPRRRRPSPRTPGSCS